MCAKKYNQSERSFILTSYSERLLISQDILEMCMCYQFQNWDLVGGKYIALNDLLGYLKQYFNGKFPSADPSQAGGTDNYFFSTLPLLWIASNTNTSIHIEFYHIVTNCVRLSYIESQNDILSYIVYIVLHFVLLFYIVLHCITL